MIQIWSGWSGLGQIHLDRKQASVQESLGLVLAERNQPATSYSVSDLDAFFPRWPRSHCAKPAWIWFGSLWLSGFVAKWIQSGSKPVCKNHPAQFWPTLLSQSESDADQIWHVYWGILSCCVQQSGSVMSSTRPACVTLIKVQNMSWANRFRPFVSTSYW